MKPIDQRTAFAQAATLSCQPCFDTCKATPYDRTMIKSFRNKALEHFFETGNPRGLSVQDTKRVARILRALWEAARPEDMNLPGYRFHGLSGDQQGRYSVRVTGNWRITFAWNGEDAIDLDLEDYQ